MIRALLLDADGVVQRMRATFRSSMEALTPHRDKEAFARAMFTAEEQCVSELADYAPVLSQLLVEWGSSASVEDALCVWHDIEVDQGVLRVVHAVRSQGLLCCIASNQQMYRARYMSEVLGFSQLFDREFYSFAMGAAKPEEQYFHAALAALDMTPDEVLFVDDRPVNVAAAARVGIHSEFFTPNAGGAALAELLSRHAVHVA